MSNAPLQIAKVGIALLVLMAGTAEALDPEENTLWTLINDYRELHGLHAVGLNDELKAAAEWMSEDMAANDYCSHTDSLGRNSRERMADFGYIQNTTTGENIVCGAETAQEAFGLMQESPEHDANMLDPYWAIGIGHAFNETSAHGWYWTIDFGGRGPAWFPPTPVLAATATPTPTPTPMPTPTPTAGPAEFPNMGTKPQG